MYAILFSVIKNRNLLLSHGNTNLRKILLMLTEEILAICDAGNIIKNAVNCSSNLIKIRDCFVPVKDNVYVVGFGKCSVPMARAIEEVLEEHLKGGIVISPYPADLKKIEVCVGTHPVPDERTVICSQKVLDFVSSLHREDLLICLISGGASSLFEIPNIPLDVYRKSISSLLISGKNIEEINKDRTKLSKVKGGKFLKYVTAENVVSLIISDVLGEARYVGSGPTWAHSAMNFVLADPVWLRSQAENILKKYGYSVKKHNYFLRNRPVEAAENLCRIVKEMNENAAVFTGETYIASPPQGKGGRNQELALYLAKCFKNKNIAAVCIGTDGFDGPTDAAGAIVDGTSYQRLIERGFDIDEDLKKHNSYPLLKAIDDLIFTGHTNSNLADICIILKN